jgi:hypothetical protein
MLVSADELFRVKRFFFDGKNQRIRVQKPMTFDCRRRMCAGEV